MENSCQICTTRIICDANKMQDSICVKKDELRLSQTFFTKKNLNKDVIFLNFFF